MFQKIRKALKSILFFAPVLSVICIMVYSAYAVDNLTSEAVVGSYKHRLYMIESVSTTLNSGAINVMGAKKLWLNVYTLGPKNRAIHIGAVTRPIFVEAKLGTLTTTSTTASNAANIGWASTSFTYRYDVGSATMEATMRGITSVVPNRYGLYGPIDIEGIPYVRLCARGVAEASDIYVELGWE